MKSRIPKTTRIAGTKWRVQPKRTVRIDNEECEGLCHYDHHLIEISVASDDDFTIMANFWHEVFHALVHQAGVDLDVNTEHAIAKQVEDYLAANCDFREKPRKRKKVSKPDEV